MVLAIAMAMDRHEEWFERAVNTPIPEPLWSYLQTYWGWVVPLVLGVCVSIGVALGLFVEARGTARRTVYAVTRARVIILRVHRDGGLTEHDYRADELVHLGRREHADGSGTLTFESARPKPGSAQRPSFVGIPEVIEVERMLRHLFGGGEPPDVARV